MAAYSQERKIVAENESILVGRSSLPLLGTTQITRHWPRVLDLHTRKAVAFLDDYTSAKNSTKRFSVVDPVTGEGKTKHDGTWRCAGNRMSESGEEEGIYQVLRKGYATSLDDDESRIRYISGNPETKSLVMAQYWPNLDPDYVGPLTNTLNGTTTVTDPKHHLGKTLTGTFAVSQVRGDLAEDGSGLIVRILSQVTAVTAATDLDNLGSVVKYNKQALHLFALQTDDSADTEGMAYALAITWTNLANTAAVRDVCGGIGVGAITDANLVTRVERIPDVSADVGWTYVDRQWTENTDGTASLTGLFRRVDWDNTWSDAIERSEGNGGQIGGLDLSTEAWAASWLWRADDIATADAAAAYLAAAAEDLSLTNQGVVGVTMSEQGEGRYAISQSVQRFYNGATDSDAIVLKIKPGMSGAQTPSIVRVWYRRTKAAKNTLTAYTPAYGPARSNYTFETVLYTHADCDISDHGDGAYTVRQYLVFTGDENVYYHHYWEEKAIRTRSTDDFVKVITYEHHERAFSSEDAAKTYIKSVVNDDGQEIKAGSVSGVKRGRFLYIAKWTERKIVSNWTSPPATLDGSGEEE